MATEDKEWAVPIAVSVVASIVVIWGVHCVHRYVRLGLLLADVHCMTYVSFTGLPFQGGHISVTGT